MEAEAAQGDGGHCSRAEGACCGSKGGTMPAGGPFWDWSCRLWSDFQWSFATLASREAFARICFCCGPSGAGCGRACLGVVAAGAESTGCGSAAGGGRMDWLELLSMVQLVVVGWEFLCQSLAGLVDLLLDRTLLEEVSLLTVEPSLQSTVAK